MLNDPKSSAAGRAVFECGCAFGAGDGRVAEGDARCGQDVFVVTHQALLLEGVADEFVWMEAGQIVERTTSALDSSMIREPHRRRGRAMSSMWAVTLATLAKDIRLEWRSKDAINSMLFFSLLVVVIFSFSFDPTGGGVAADRRRTGVGGVFVCGGGGAESDLGAGAAQSGAGRVPRFSGSGEFAVSGQGAGKFYFRHVLEALMTPLFIVFYNLRALGPAWQLIPVGAAGNVGAGGEWDILRGHVTAHSQPRDHAAAAAVSDFHSCCASDGREPPRLF